MQVTTSNAESPTAWQNGEAHNKLHVTLLNALGVPATTFGDPQVGSGPLAGVLK